FFGQFMSLHLNSGQANAFKCNKTASVLHFQDTSSSTGEPSGRLATPKTRREETAWSPKTSRSNSDAASATFGCSVNSGVAATYTPSLTTCLTRFNEPSCFLVSASTLSAAVYAASRPAFTSRSLPTTPT